MKTPHIVFLDSLGRTIIGKHSSDTPDKLFVSNPVIVHITPSSSKPGEMSVQLIPLFFREFLADKSADSVWGFVRSSITESTDIVLDSKLTTQYDQMFTSIVLPPAGLVSSEGEVIKMFDEQ